MSHADNLIKKLENHSPDDTFACFNYPPGTWEEEMPTYHDVLNSLLPEVSEWLEYFGRVVKDGTLIFIFRVKDHDEILDKDNS